MKLSECAAVLKYLGEVYGVTVSADKAKAYHVTLKHLPRLQLVDTATAWVENNKWFPKPAELLDLSARHNKPEGDPTSERAWWTAFVRGYESTDDLTEADVREIFAGVNEAAA